jgi:hypothetical protein
VVRVGKKAGLGGLCSRGGRAGGFYSDAQAGLPTVSLLQAQYRVLPSVTLVTCRLSSVSLTRVAT